MSDGETNSVPELVPATEASTGKRIFIYGEHSVANEFATSNNKSPFGIVGYGGNPVFIRGYG